MSDDGAARLAGKVALITGGGSGIGQMTAQFFAAQGAVAVIAVDRDEQGLEATGKLVAEAGAESMSVAGDVTDTDLPTARVAEAIERFGRLDVVMTAAFRRCSTGERVRSSRSRASWRSTAAGETRHTFHRRER